MDRPVADVHDRLRGPRRASTSGPTRALVAERHRTDHHEFVVHPDAVDLVERLVWHHDQPFGDSSAVPTFLLSEVTARARDGRAVGRRRRRAVRAATSASRPALAARRYARLPGPLRARSRGAVGAAAARGAARARGAASSASRASPSGACPTRTAAGSASSRTPERDALLDGAPRRLGARRTTARSGRASEGAHPLDRLLDLNLRTYLLDDLLVKADRMSMAHGLEVRSPFLDTELLVVRHASAAAR